MSSPEDEDKSDKDSGTIITKQISELSQSDLKLNELVMLYRRAKMAYSITDEG